MRSIAAALCALLLPPIIFYQDHVIVPAATAPVTIPVIPGIFALPGGVAFEVKKDEMTDARVCAVSTPLWGVYAVFDGHGAAIHSSSAIDIDYNEKALMRIADHQPFELRIPPKPKTILIPMERTADFIGALYSRERIRVRFNRWPGGDVDDVELEVGDFAAGYDLGVELCGWPKPSLARVTLSHEPQITKGIGGIVDARFGGREGWTVYSDPRRNYCSVKGPFARSVATFMDGARQSDSDLGVVRYFTSHGKFVAATEHRPGMPAPVIAMMSGESQVGEDGMIEVHNRLYSFFGFRDALRFAARTCNQPMLAP